ncbi:hypothetical protein CEQ31_011095 [Serratia odorifera]|nr:hypothetical protein CEQ31_011095 [Serratia odorifera]RII71353.1 hypothetical protein DX901_15230 [Serratia odorifera]
MTYLYECTNHSMLFMSHGVSGVGGSNPLMPTKHSFRNQPVAVGFFMPVIGYRHCPADHGRTSQPVGGRQRSITRRCGTTARS